jgi:hypothetical protein
VSGGGNNFAFFTLQSAFCIGAKRLSLCLCGIIRCLVLGFGSWFWVLSSKFYVKGLDSVTVENLCLKFSSEFSVLSLY